MLHWAVRPPSVRGHQWLISPCILGTDPTHLQPELFIILTQTLAHTELYLVRGKCPLSQDKQEGLLKCEVAVCCPCLTALLYFFDNSHLLLLLCAVQMTKWGNGLWKMIINAAGPLTRKEHFLYCSQEKEHPFKPCSIHCTLYSLHASLYNSLDFLRFCVSGHFLHVLFICCPGFNSCRVLCLIPRNVQCINSFMNHGKNTNCFATLAYKSCILLLCWIFPSSSSWESPHEYTSSPSYLEPDPIAGDWTVVLRAFWNHSLVFSYAAAVRYQKQKEQFKMIMKRLLSYGDGKCGVWHALARKSLDVTRGV